MRSTRIERFMDQLPLDWAAVDEYTAAIGLDSAHAASYLGRGQLLMMQGKRDEAIADFHKVVELADNPEMVKTAQARLDQLG